MFCLLGESYLYDIVGGLLLWTKTIKIMGLCLCCSLVIESIVLQWAGLGTGGPGPRDQRRHEGLVYRTIYDCISFLTYDI